jgi:hypothetical protein
MANLSQVGAIEQSSEPTFARYFFAETYNIDFVIDPIFSSYIPFFEDDHRKSMVSRIHSKVSNLFRKEVDELIMAGSAIPLYIPPVPAVTLNRSGGNRNKIINEILSLRSEFKEFRDKYRQYQKIMNSPRLFGAPSCSLLRIRCQKNAASDITKKTNPFSIPEAFHLKL